MQIHCVVFTEAGSNCLAEGDKDLAQCMGAQDANLVAVDAYCSTVHAIQDMPVAHTHDWEAVEDAGNDYQGHSMVAAGEWHKQGMAENTQH